MEPRPSNARIEQGGTLLAALDAAGLPIEACYWRRVRPTTSCWVLVLTSPRFRAGSEPAVGRLLELWEENSAELPSIGPLDLWTLAEPEPEVQDYARALGPRQDDDLALAPACLGGDGALPPAVVYRLPSP